MRNLVYYITVSLDGYFSGPHGDLEHFEPSEPEHQYANDLLGNADAVLQGRVMHEVMSYWDGVDPQIRRRRESSANSPRSTRRSLDTSSRGR